VPIDAETKALLPVIGANVARLRRARGLTQAQLAEALGCEPTYVQKVEYGTGTPSLPMLVALAKHLGVAIGMLFRTATPKPPTRGRPKQRTASAPRVKGRR
jgi:transcriptional regulator with XRE-family HTH domain